MGPLRLSFHSDLLCDSCLGEADPHIRDYISCLIMYFLHGIDNTRTNNNTKISCVFFLFFYVPQA